MNRKNRKKWQKTLNCIKGLTVIGLLILFTTLWVKLLLSPESDMVVGQDSNYKIITLSFFALIILLGKPIYVWSKGESLMIIFVSLIIISELTGIICTLVLQSYNYKLLHIIMFSYFPLAYWLLLFSIAQYKKQKEDEENNQNIMSKIYNSFQKN